MVMRATSSVADRYPPNRNDFKVFSLVTGGAVRGAIVLCPQLLKVAAQGGLPCSVERFGASAAAYC
ncbi:hypothetical protein LP416_28130 [Polaromonas sp. P2-4]|nr:hypothetical protein LP416_28130 [Polaromonas sp. P2-4]